MTTMNYIGLHVHKKTISYCVKDVSGRVQQEGKVGSTDPPSLQHPLSQPRSHRSRQLPDSQLCGL
jgi:hypothetical protein